MRRFLFMLLLGVATASAAPLPPFFDGLLKASLLVEPDRKDPLRLNVYLRLVDETRGNIDWMTDGLGQVQAQVFDASGRAIPKVEWPATVSFIGLPTEFVLPALSRLDWCLSANDPIPVSNPQGDYCLFVGADVWMIPKDKIGSYSLRLTLRGWAGGMPISGKLRPERERVLAELPAQKIVITPTPAN